MTTRDDVLRARLRSLTEALRRTLDERDKLLAERDEQVAIVGFGCRFPGAEDPASFWELLERGGDAIGPLAQRWEQVGARPTNTPRWAGLLSEVGGFDPEFFGITPREALSLDPQQRLLMEIAWEAIEHAGIPSAKLMGSRTGVYVGASFNDYLEAVESLDAADKDAYGISGNNLCFAAGRLSYVLGLEGPSLTVDTACSSSLVAVHLACQSLRLGECDLALAGGVNLVLSPESMERVARTQALAADGRCKTFDAAADGYVRGEGCGLVVLKRLTDAHRDGDRAWAVIRGSAVNQDGRSTGLTAPNVLSQESLLREALRRAHVEPGAVGYVETHGTGTSLGDPIEVEALAEALADPGADSRPCVLGAVKTNLGHLESAAGIAGLIKAILAFAHERIPKNLHLRTPNPRLRLAGSRLQLALQATPWPRGERVAGVSAFGLSGTNAHVILGEAPAPTPTPTPAVTTEAQGSRPRLFLLSARTHAALAAVAARLAERVRRDDALDLGDLALSLATTRMAMEQRATIVAATRDELLCALDRIMAGEAPSVGTIGTAGATRGKRAFLFSGQGAQTLGMGRVLATAWPAFREAFDRSAALFDAVLERPLREIMWAEPGSAEASLLDQTAYTQPAIFTVEYALCELWRSWGIEPDLLLGHSIGEIVAAHIAGVFSLEDAVTLVSARGRLMQALPVGGAMASIAASELEVRAALTPHLSKAAIAAVNGPEQIVIAGVEAIVDEVAAGFEARGIKARRLRVSHAFHSPLMAAMEAELRSIAESITYNAPQPSLVSCLNGALAGAEIASPEHWVRHIREAVRFADGVAALDRAGAETYVEVGPRAALLGLIPLCLPEADPRLLATLRSGRDEHTSALAALGGCWVSGAAPRWDRVFTAGESRVPLPTYPWQRRRFWITRPELSRGPALYQISWEDAPLGASSPVDGRRWILVAPAGVPLAEELAARLGACDRVEPEGLAAALDSDTPADGVICLWTPEHEEEGEEAGDEQGDEQDPPTAALRLACEALTVVQALQQAGRVPTWWVTSGAIAAGPREALSPATSTLWGLGRTVMEEHPELGCTLIDIAAGETVAGASAVLQELGANDGERQIAWRGEQRRVARLVRTTDEGAGAGAGAGAGLGALARLGAGSVLITGGLGSLGSRISLWLAEQGVNHLVLCGRRGLDRPEAAALVTALEERGARVTVAAVDVGDREALASLLAAIPPELPLRGVIHTAGVLDDGILASQTPERFARVFAAKVTGAWHLHSLTTELDLDLFVMFSSVAGTLGAAGQGNYAAANSFLDGLAAHRKSLDLPAQSLAWGAWAEGGMATELSARAQARLERRGHSPISSTEGLALLGRSLLRPEASLVVASFDLELVGKELGSPSRPLWRSLLPAAPIQSARQESGSLWRSEIASLDPQARAEAARNAVARETASVLGWTDRSVPTQRPLRELGLDSLMAVELRNALAQMTGMRLPATLAFDYPTIDAIAGRLLDGSTSTAPITIAATDEPIAIVGIGCRYPGGIVDPDSFWRLLDGGVDAIDRIPGSRWDVDALYDPDPDARGKMTTREGGFVTDIDRFDPGFFGISDREAIAMDPQQRLLLETSWEAIERAGIAPHQLSGGDTGVFVGLSYQEYASLAGDLTALDGYVSTGTTASVASGRISYVLGLKGPSITVDTACSSSLVTVHLACESLRRGECSMALAGGVALVLTPSIFVEFSRLRGLAADGRCKSFAASADGVGWAEGCGMIALRRLCDAQRDGDPILAVIRGSAINQDGRSNGLTAPNGPAQEAVIRAALSRSGLTPADVDYVECHGTGTSLGDPIEAQALGAVMDGHRPPDRPLRIGSVKSNLGHTQASAGVAGIIKVTLAMEHGLLPRTLHAERPSPHIDWDKLPLDLTVAATPWPHGDRPRRAGVSSFGISGTNAHIVLEEPPLEVRAAHVDTADTAENRAELMLLSAQNEASLAEYAARLELFASGEGQSVPLADMSFTLATARDPMDHRVALVAGDRSALIEGLATIARGETPPGAIRGEARSERAKVVFVFPGQGSQWLGMGRTLLSLPAFRSAIAACDQAIADELGDDAPWSLLGELSADPSTSQLDRIDVVQPLLFAVEVGLAALWQAWGVTPDVVVGHSMGEIAAAHIAGALSLNDAVAIICRRSRLLRKIRGQGEMAVVSLSATEAAEAIKGREDRLSVAVSNSPSSTVIAGEPQALAAVLAEVEAKEIFCRRVKVDVASHSPQVEPLRAELLASLASLRPQAGSVSMISTVTGAVIEGEGLDADYWAENLRRPVRFGEVIQGLVSAERPIFIEISPHPILLDAIAEIQRSSGEDDSSVAVGTLRREAERESLLEAAAALWSCGHPISTQQIFGAREGRRVPLPTYAWQRDRYWFATPSATPRSWRVADEHPLLGAPQTLAFLPGARLWETTLDLERLPWLHDHRVDGEPIMPASGFLEMALSAGEASLGELAAVSEFAFVRPLELDRHPRPRVQVVTREESPGRLRIQIASRLADSDAWTECAHGLLSIPEGETAPRIDVATLRDRLRAPIDGEALYDALRLRGVDYGPTMRGLIELWRGDGEALGRLRLQTSDQQRRHERLPPALVDSGILVLVGCASLFDEGSWVPVACGPMQIVSRPPQTLWCHARLLADEDGAEGALLRRRADLWFVDDSGAVIAECLGLVVQQVSRTLAPSGDDASAPGLRAELAAATPEQGIAALTELLRAQAARVMRIPESRLLLDTSLIRQGLDSLMSLELKHRVSSRTGVQIPVTQLLRDMTIVRLAADILAEITGLDEHADAPGADSDTINDSAAAEDEHADDDGAEWMRIEL